MEENIYKTYTCQKTCVQTYTKLINSTVTRETMQLKYGQKFWGDFPKEDI